ncbi:MAG: cardiolipin synthase [Bacteroidaceae bacterium]|nr:cardiolipin synthase [Bacteroidaceae bacterium]
MITTILTLIVSALYLLIVIGTVLVVMLENRQPERTIAWVVAIVLLPFVGLVMFYFFGRNLRSRKRRKLYHNNTTTYLDAYSGSKDTLSIENDTYYPLKKLCQEEFGAPLHRLEQAVLLESGTDFVQKLIETFDSAKSHVYLETYIIEDDAVGNAVGEALLRAAKRVVDVRLLYDDVGCWRVKSAFFKHLSQGGVHVASFMPVRFPALTHKINYRNHRKVCVVDNEWGFVGGMNLAKRYVGEDGMHWQDLHLLLQGAAVERLESIFLSDWFYVTHSAEPQPQHFRTDTSSLINTSDVAAAANSIQIVTSDPLTSMPQLMTAYVWAAIHARRYLYIQTPYFMPTEPFLHALKTAAMTGVDVRVMMPRKPDGVMLRHINDSYVGELLAAGIRVWLYEGGFLHSKSIVMDDNWCSIGSANMDFRSFLNNIEVSALIYDTRTACKVRERFEADQKQCSEIDHKRWQHRGLKRRIKESATRIFSPLF